MPRRYRKRRKRAKSGGRKFKQRVLAIINTQAEHKYLDEVQTRNSIDTFPAGPHKLVWPVQGDSVNERIGDEFHIRSIKYTLNCGSPSAAANGVVWRFVVFQWMQYAGVGAPLAGDVLQTTAAGLAIVSPLQRDNLESRRLVPLYDRRFTTVFNGNNASKSFEVNLFGKRIKRKRIDLAPGTITGEMGDIYWIMFVDSPVTCFFDIYTRMTYVDM